VKRPVGIAILSFFMLTVGIVGAGHTWGNLTQPWDGVLFSPVNGVLAFLYGITGFASAVGFWRMKPWGLHAFFGWLVVLAMMTVVMFMGPFGRMELSVFVLFIAVLAALVVRYARRQIFQRT
jgi:hypothetical protein